LADLLLCRIERRVCAGAGHSITSSARVSSASGIVSPRAAEKRDELAPPHAIFPKPQDHSTRRKT
jgi:hypothetical protein